jgi:hypothetical protein
MTEQIGLQGVFDLKDWDAGTKRYQSQLQKTISETNKASGSFAKSWNQMGATVGKTTALMGGALVAAGAAATAAIAGFTASGIKKAADLEAQLSTIAATLNMTAEQVAPLNDLILELGLDPNLKVSATEAADAIENLARNGLSMTEIMDGAARSTVLLANATGADFGLAADIATDTMAIFNIEAADMARAVDQITGVTNASKFTIDDYRLALAQGGGVASAVGMEFEDFNATIAAISPLFASGSDAGTSLKTMLLRLIPASTKAEEAMSELGLLSWDNTRALQMLEAAGIKPVSNSLVDVSSAMQSYFAEQFKVNLSTEEGVEKWAKWATEVGLMKNQFFDANGQLKDMNEISVVLNKALEGLSEEQKNTALATIFGTDAMRAAVGVAQSGVVVYKTAAEAAKALGVSVDEAAKFAEGGITQFEAMALTLGSIDAAEQAATRMDNFKGSLEILQGTIETLQIRIGQAFLPLLQQLAEWATQWVAAHGPAIAAAFETFATNVSSLIGYISEVAATGSLMNEWLDKMSPTLATVVLNVVALAGAIGVGLGAALSFIQQHMDAFQGALMGIAAVLAAATITAGITAIAGALATLLTPMGLVILAAAGLGAAWNTNFLGIRDTTLSVVGEIQTAFTPLTTAIQEFGSGALTEIQAFVTGNQTEFTNLQAIWDGATVSVGNLTAKITEQFPMLTPVFDGFAVAVELVVSQVQAQFVLLQEATTAFVGIVTSLISGDWAGAWQSAQDLAGAFVTYIQTTFANLSEVFAVPFAQIKALVTETFTGLVADVTAQLPGWQAQLTEWGNAASQWITDAVPVVQQKMTEWAAAAQGYVTDNLPTWQATLAQWGVAASQWIADASVIVNEKMTEWKTAVVDYVVENLPTWQATLASWGEAAWQWIVDAIPGVKREIGAWYAELNVFVTSNLPDWIATLSEWTTAAWQWIVDAVPLVAQELNNWYTALSDALADNLPAWQDAFEDWIAAAWEWIAETAPLVVTAIGNWYTRLARTVAEKLPTFTAEMLKWATALVEWIGDTAADALPKLGAWLGKIIAWIPTGIVLLAAEMLKFSTVLVTWISDNAADALPELGKWLGKILAWIPIGVVALGAGVVKLAGALISWIAGGGGGVSVSDSATGQVNAEFDKFLAALKKAIENITGGFVEGVKAFVDSWKETMSEHVDWNQLGTDIMTRVKDGIESVKNAIVTTIQGIIDAIKKKFADAVQSFVNIGKDIVDGIIRGLGSMKQALLDKVSELVNAIPQWMRDLLGIGSPSKVMMEIGRDIMEGWMLGMKSMERQFYDFTLDIANGITRIAERAGAGAINAFTRALQSFSSIGILDAIGGKDEAGNFLLPGAGAATEAIRRQQEQLKFLKTQADLIEAIRESGADPAGVLQGITLGPNADPVKMAEVVARTMERLNQGLAQSLQAAMSNAQGVVDFLRDNRESITDIEDKFTREHLSTLDRYKDRLAQIDEDLAEREARAIATGRTDAMADVRKLDDMRRVLAAQIETLLEQRNQMAALMEQLPTSDNQRAREAIESFRTRFIDPLAESFETANIEGRASILQAIQGYQNTIRQFAQSIPRIAAHERHALEAAEGFGEAVRTRIDMMLANLYNPANVGQQSVLIEDLRAFSRSLIDIRNEINRRIGARQTGQSIIEMLTGGPKDLLGTFEDTIASIDARIERAQADALTTGNAMILNNIRLLDSERDLATQRLQDLLNLRRNRQSIEDIEERFTNNQLTTMERYAQQLENIDQRIANAERAAIAGDTGAFSHLAQLDRERRALLANVESFLTAQNRIDEIQDRLQEVLAAQPASENQRGQAAIERWRETMIDPLIAGLDALSIAGRTSRLQEIERRMRLIQGFAEQLPSLTGAEERLMQALEGFGTGARSRAERLLALVYDPRMASVAAGRAQAVHDFANSLINLRGELERMSGRRLSGEDIIERMMGGFDQLTAYQQALDAVDRQIADAQAAILETGDVRGLDRIRTLDERRAQRQADIENFIRQSQILEDIMRDVKNFSGPGQASAERFFQEHIQSIADAFSFPMRSVERDAWIRAARDRVGMINRFVEQMRQLERVQNRVAGNQSFAHLADEFATLQDILLPEEQRGSLIRQLDSYITQMMRLQEIQQDITAGRGINPLVERFASERLDTIARQLEDINMTEAERNRLIEQYRIEQEKILALQRQQQQLEFINQQLALIEQLRSLDEEEDWSVNVENILSGIQFGINASIDDLMMLTGRVLDELVRFANHQLGIASPSKVFAKVGTNIMAGLEAGILAGMRQPMNALRNAAGSLVPYSLQQRSLSVNMGGVTINNMMDDVMFEARIRQIVRSEFAT